MKKDKKLTNEEKEAAKVTAERNQVIRDFNMNNAGRSWINPERIPTDEDKKMVKDAFDAITAKLKENRTYLIADKDNALRVVNFIKNFNETCFWMQRSFVGILNLDKELNDFIQEYAKEPQDLRLSIGATQFTYNIFENYAGIGIEAAKKMADMWDEYIPIYDTLRGHVENMQLEYEYVNRLQEVWQLAEQGYFCLMLDTDKYRAIGIDVFTFAEEHNTEEKKEEDVITPEVVEK